MKITICGSAVFIDEMVAIQKELEALGHEVKLPPHEMPDNMGKMIPVKKYYAIRKSAQDGDTWVWKRKEEAMQNHFAKVEWSDAILVCNFDKNGVLGYVGANTFLEMGVAFYLKKSIYLLNPVSDTAAKEEILGMWPIVLNGKLMDIK